MPDDKSLETFSGRLKPMTEREGMRTPGSVALVKKLWNVPMVKVYVGPDGEVFTLPKDVLCECSEIFRAALDGNSKEAIDGEVRLPLVNTREFHYVLGFCVSKVIILEPEDCTTVSKRILTYLKIILAADILLVAGLTTVACQKLKVIFEDRSYVKAEHIRTAAQLPKGKALGVLLAELVAVEYMQANGSRGDEFLDFRFDKEHEELESFASDISKVTKLMHGRKHYNSDENEMEYLDPIDFTWFAA